MGNMKNIVFKEQEGVFVADFASEGNCVIQIDNGNVEPLKIYRHMPEMEPSAYDAIPLHDPYQRVIDLCVPAGMMIRIVSTTAVTAAKMIVLPQASGNGSSVTGATASVDANVGTPSVDVTMKEGKLNFAFKNLKGQKGEQGAAGAKGDKGDTGAKIKSDEGEELGVIADVLQTGANDVYVVKKAGANDLLIPAIKDCILDVDVENGTMKVHLLAGLR